MINGFEYETGPLDDTELQMVAQFVKGFSGKIGADNAVTSDQIIFGMKARGYKITGARVRKIIHYIRIKGLVKNLVATSKGYYIETDPDKIKEYVNGLKQRAAAITAVANSYT